jgi:hypothetical protein
MDAVNELLFPGVTDPGEVPARRKTWLAAVHELLREGDGVVAEPEQVPDVGRNHHRIGVPHAPIFSQMGFRAGTAAELNREATPEQLKLLSPDEAQELRRLGVERLGDVFFTWLD